jgi:hypothetical protein
MLTSIISVYAYIPRGAERCRSDDKKQERQPIESPTLTEFHWCRPCLEPPHCAARLSKPWDQVG